MDLINKRSFYLAAYFAILCLLSTCNGDGMIFVKFIRYINPGGLGANGHCCDGKALFCQRHGCDHTFTICLDDDESPKNIESCRYGKYQSARISNQDINNFGSRFGGLLNPMTFYILDGPLPNATLKVKVYDDDKNSYTKRDYVDYLELSGIVPDDGEEELYISKARTILRFSVRSICAHNHYGPRCGTFCPPPHGGEHYHCNPDTGEKVCETGWAGEDCTEMDSDFIDRPNADCDRLVTQGGVTTAGRYDIHVGHMDPFPVFCDVTDDGKGWTVIMRRTTGDLSFTRTWDRYRDGFGRLEADEEFWLGLEKIYLITNQRRYRLRVELQVGGTGSLRLKYAEYKYFMIKPEVDHFRMFATGYSGSAGDALTYTGAGGTRNHQGMPFSTTDRDNDMSPENNCAKTFGSGWWYNDCYWALLTGKPGCGGGKCLSWNTLGDERIHSATMMLLPEPRF